MSKVYENRPNIVTLSGSDESGSFERHVVGLTLDEVIEALTLSLDGAEAKAFEVTPKAKRHRRTKAQLATVATAQTTEVEAKPWP